MNYKAINVPLEKLILDPNNPRFSKNEYELISDESKFADSAIQQEALAKMISGDLFDTMDLEKSIKANGYVSIVQPMLVRQIGDHYLVIEGNRRLSALKQLFSKHNSGKSKDVLSPELLDTMSNLPVYDYSDASKEEISVLLGMIHVGGTKDWDLLPSAFYIYKLYADLLCTEHNWNSQQIQKKFFFDREIGKKVAAQASISTGKVKRNLMLYRVFRQLADEAHERTGDETAVDVKKASLIDESCKNSGLARYFLIDTSTFLMESDGIDRFLHLIVDVENGDPVIKNPNDLRDFKKVLAQGGDEHIDRIYEDGEKPGAVLAEIVSLRNERTLHTRLKQVKEELGKIDIDGLGVFAEVDKELLDHIDKKIKRIRAAAAI